MFNRKKKTEKKYIKLNRKLLLFLVILTFLFTFPYFHTRSEISRTNQKLWDLQSIDTMKYSRDKAKEKVNDILFESVIDTQINNISDTGATHVAIATPYDEEFIPYLTRWVKSARNHKLKVWFRGNWSGWEKWFRYSSITRAEHIDKTRKFILDNRDLFVDEDIFTACPECENGGPGDPRKTGDVNGYREFLISEYQVTKDSFKSIGIDVKSNYISMNGDVARLVMDKKTTKSLDGIVVIDHYVQTPNQLKSDIEEIAESSGGEIILGEFGVPIPDIHGQMTGSEQADWIAQALDKLTHIKELKGVNYWVGTGGSSQIWNLDATDRPAVKVFQNYFSPTIINGIVKNEFNKPIKDAKISFRAKEIITDSTGNFHLPILGDNPTIKVSAAGYKDQEIKLATNQYSVVITLKGDQTGILFQLKLFFYNLIH